MVSQMPLPPPQQEEVRVCKSVAQQCEEYKKLIKPLNEALSLLIEEAQVNSSEEFKSAVQQMIIVRDTLIKTLGIKLVDKGPWPPRSDQYAREEEKRASQRDLGKLPQPFANYISKYAYDESREELRKRMKREDERVEEIEADVERKARGARKARDAANAKRNNK